MEAIRKQATKLREQVARQQQCTCKGTYNIGSEGVFSISSAAVMIVGFAVFKQFGGGGYGGSDNVVTDEAELHQHQRLERLYISTRAGKHFQRDIVRGVEGYIVTGSKQVEIGTKLSEDSRKYGSDNTCTSGNTLSKAALSYGRARAQMEKERGNLLKALGTQVAEPLRAMVLGAPLDDARHLAQRYDRMRQEAEAQAIEVSKRQAKVRETPGNPDLALKLDAAEVKLHDLKSNMAILGKEAAAAMAAVESQQQRLTLQRLIAMVEAERTYHQRVLQILGQLEGEMLSERQRIEAAPTAPTPSVDTMPPPPAYEEVNGIYASQTHNGSTDAMGYFLGEVVHPYQAESDVELTLSVGDYVVVRKVTNNGWAEGECKGKAGWFPFGYIERRDRVLASKMAEVF
ncbi:SH3 domain-containing protein 2 [Citrus sinensis]|uniref:SH3 domain-containing protein 2 n=1 Tax=Citrus sinensis TaxID=2711 RepID=A0ACB8IHB6_CITSI|nr:SH3 domain-containing protein 2 [Citrus sinensis]